MKTQAKAETKQSNQLTTAAGPGLLRYSRRSAAEQAGPGREKKNMKKETAATHTPGPWKLKTWTYNTPGRAKVPTVTTKSDVIAEIYPLWYVCRDNSREEERQANARLIAAAPDLLDALECLIHAIENETAQHGRIIDGIEHARAAITKATN